MLAVEGASSLTSGTAHNLAAALLPHLGRAKYVVDVGSSPRDGFTPLFVAGMPVIGIADALNIPELAGRSDLQVVRADSARLPLRTASVPAVHLCAPPPVGPGWWAALNEVARVVAPGGVFAAVVTRDAEDSLTAQVRRRIHVSLDLRLAVRDASGAEDQPTPERVDAVLGAHGFRTPMVAPARGHRVTTARTLVAEACAQARAGQVADPSAEKAVKAEVLAWTAQRAGGTDVALLLTAGRTYRVYRKG